MEYNFTLPIVAAAGAATKWALDNESALVRIQKVYGDGTQSAQDMKNEINALSKAFVLLSDEFGVSQSDVLNIAADWAAAGVSGVALAKSVQLTLQTMILGEQTAAEATTSLISIQAQYGLSIAQLTDTINLLNMVENQTAVSMTGLISAFTRTAGVASSLGISTRYLAADIAALTPTAGTATAVGNALKTIFTRLAAPTDKISSLLKDMGINTKSFVYESANGQSKLLMVASAYDKLSDAQKNFVASQIAGVYQVNKFQTLMKELISSNGYYAKALASTSDKTKIYNQAQKELNQVLTSNPQRLKEIWVTLQNAAADIITPMIPLILYLAQTVQSLVSRFSNLNPAMQKAVLIGLAALAFVGPIVRYFGAFATLVGELSKAFGLLSVGTAKAVGGIVKMISLPISAFFGAFTSGLSLVGRGLSLTLRALPTLWMWALQASVSVLLPFVRAVDTILGTLWISLTSGMAFFKAASLGLMNLLWDGFENIMVAGAGKVGAIWWSSLKYMEETLVEFAAVSGHIWTMISTNPLKLLGMMWSGILTLFTRGLVFLSEFGVAVVDVLTGPIGIAITAAVLLLVIFWDDIKKIWSNVINWFTNSSGNFAGAFKPLTDAVGAVRNFIVKAFNSLPGAIQNAMIAVVNTIAAAAKAIYGWFQHINPWTRHSPSHVDNVTTGVAEIQKQFGELKTVESAFDRAASDLNKFAQAVKNVEHAAEASKYAAIRKELVAVAKDALPYFDQLLRDLYPLENQLAAVNVQLQAQQAVVDKLKDSLDAANTTLSTQSDVLDAMKNSIDDFSSKVNAINGDLEVLSGVQKSLRDAGAGSEILSGYQDQIDALKTQKKGINDQLTAASNAYTVQKNLVDSLTASRDALQATYDKENASLEVIQKNYDAINDKIQAITSAISDFDSAANTLSDAAKNATGSASGSGGIPGAGANFPDVSGGGKLGRELPGIPDQSSLIDGFTKDLQGQLGKMFGGFSILAPVKKAWNASVDWLKKIVGPALAPVGSLFSAAFSNLPNPLKNVAFTPYLDAIKGFLASIGRFFQNTWKQIGPPLQKIGSILGGEFINAWKKISPEIAKFKDLVGPLGQMFKDQLPILKYLAGIIGGLLVGSIIVLVNIIADILKPSLDFVIDVIANVIKIIRGLAEIIIGVFSGNMSLAFKGVEDLFGGLWNIIVSLFKNGVALLNGIVEGLVNGILDFFKWIYDELVGHSIIPDLINGMIFWFQLGYTLIKESIQQIGAIIMWVWTNVAKPVFAFFKTSIDGWVLAWKGGVALIKTLWSAFESGLSSLWSNVSKTVGWISTKWKDITSGFSSMKSTVTGYINTFVSAVLGIKTRIAKAFDGMFDGIKNAFKSAINWVISKWNNLSFSIPGVDTHIPGVGKVGGFTLSTPNIGLLAAGGMVANKATAIVGEGRRGYPEFVIPTDPIYHKRATMLFEALGAQLGLYNIGGGNSAISQLSSQLNRSNGDKISMFASGGILGRGTIRTKGSGGVVLVAANSTKNEYHFHGDLSFPNISSPDDAQKFLDNLETLIGS